VGIRAFSDSFLHDGRSVLLPSSFRMAHYTVGITADQVSGVPWSKLSSKHFTVPDRDRFSDIAAKFKKRRSFPNVTGCTDGKHTRVKFHPKAGSLFSSSSSFCRAPGS
jgi:hypothetical protein